MYIYLRYMYFKVKSKKNKSDSAVFTNKYIGIGSLWLFYWT